MPENELASYSSGELAVAVQPFVDRQELAGAVMLVADREKVLALETVGYSDAESRTPMLPDAMFWIASMTKAFTGTAVMMLVDDGLVDLQAPLTEYLPEFADLWMIAEQDDEHRLLVRPPGPLTLHDLLTHTSGMQFCTAAENPTRDYLPLCAASLTYAATPLLHPPGTQYLYSNMGLNTAGRVTEVVAGCSYATFLQERLLDPLGLKDTTFWPQEEQIARLARTHRPREDSGLEVAPLDRMQHPLSDRHRQPWPAGGLFSCATDCAVFCQWC